MRHRRVGCLCGAEAEETGWHSAFTRMLSFPKEPIKALRDSIDTKWVLGKAGQSLALWPGRRQCRHRPRVLHCSHSAGVSLSGPLEVKDTDADGTDEVKDEVGATGTDTEVAEVAAAFGKPLRRDAAGTPGEEEMAWAAVAEAPGMRGARPRLTARLASVAVSKAKAWSLARSSAGSMNWASAHTRWARANESARGYSVQAAWSGMSKAE